MWGQSPSATLVACVACVIRRLADHAAACSVVGGAFRRRSEADISTLSRAGWRPTWKVAQEGPVKDGKSPSSEAWESSGGMRSPSGDRGTLPAPLSRPSHLNWVGGQAAARASAVRGQCPFHFRASANADARTESRGRVRCDGPTRRMNHLSGIRNGQTQILVRKLGNIYNKKQRKVGPSKKSTPRKSRRRNIKAGETTPRRSL